MVACEMKLNCCKIYKHNVPIYKTHSDTSYIYILLFISLLFHFFLVSNSTVLTIFHIHIHLIYTRYTIVQ